MGTTIDWKPIGFQRNPGTNVLHANEFYDQFKENKVLKAIFSIMLIGL